MYEASQALQREITPDRALPGPDVLERVLAEKYCDCMSAAFGRTFFRFVPGRAALDLVGEPLSERAKDELLDSLRAFASAESPQAREGQWLILPPGTPRLNRGADVALLWRVNGKPRPT